MEAVAVVVDEEYRGRRRRKIRWLNAPSRVAGGMDGADVAALGACLRARGARRGGGRV